MNEHILNETEKEIKETEKESDNTKKIKKAKRRRLTLIIGGSIAILSILFFLSFYISYKKITADRNDVKTASDMVKEQAMIIADLEKEIVEKDKEIERLKEQIEEYELRIEELEYVEEYSKAIEEELEDLRKKAHVSSPRQTPSVASVPRQSEVQKDIYQRR